MKVVRLYHGGRDPAHRLRDRALLDAGAEVVLVIPRRWAGSEHHDHVDEPGLRVVEVDVRRPGDVNRHTLTDAAAFMEVVTDVGPDLVDIAEEPFSSVAHQILGLLPATLPVVTYTAQNLDKRWPPPFCWWERQAFARVNGIYPCSRQAASVVRGKGFTGVVQPIPLGFDPRRYHPGDQQAGDETLQLGLFGRMEAYKGVLDAVRVLAAVRRHRSARLTLVGEGPALADALDLAARLQVDGAVEHHPWQPLDRLVESYRAVHFLLAPSRATPRWVEQFGRTLIEGQASGCVVAGYASGSIPEVAGPGALIVPEGDADALAAAIVALAGDPAAFASAREVGTTRSRRYSWEQVAEQQVAFYRTCMAHPPTPPGPAASRRPRASAVAEFGRPATVNGQERPFALPILRSDTPLSRGLAAALDAWGSRSEGSTRGRPG